MTCRWIRQGCIISLVPRGRLQAAVAAAVRRCGAYTLDALHCCPGIDALHYGDNAFKDGEMIDAFMAYSKGAQMEPINKPMQVSATAADMTM